MATQGYDVSRAREMCLGGAWLPRGHRRKVSGQTRPWGAALLGLALALAACREQPPEALPAPPAEGELTTDEINAELERLDRRNEDLRRSLAEERSSRAAHPSPSAPGPAGAPVVTAGSASHSALASAWASSGDPATRAQGRCLAAWSQCSGEGAALDVCVRDLARCSVLDAAPATCCPTECVELYGRERRSGATQGAAAAAAFVSPGAPCVARALEREVLSRREATRTVAPRPISLADVGHELRRAKGAPVLVAVFASWCPTCRETMPEVADFLVRHPEVKPLLVSTDEDDANLRTYLRQTALPGVRILGAPRVDGGLAGALDPFGVRYAGKIPVVALLDGSGRVVATDRRRTDLERALAAAK